MGHVPKDTYTDKKNTKGVSEFYSNLTLIKSCVTGKLKAARNPIRLGFEFELKFSQRHDLSLIWVCFPD